MVNVIVIFGTLIALNLGFGYWMSNETGHKQVPKGQVEVETVQPKPVTPSAPQQAPKTEEAPAAGGSTQ